MNVIDLIIAPDLEEPGAAEVLVDGAIAGKSCRFLLDTGAAVSRVICDDYTAGLPVADTRESSGAFSKSHLEMVVVPEVIFGSISKTDFSMARLPAGKHGRNIIGMDLLKEHSLFFDFAGNKLEIDAQCPEAAGDCRALALSGKSHPYVEVSFAGISAQAVWDTGAGLTVVDSEFVKDNPALFRQLSLSRGTDSSGTTAETPMLVMKACVIGGVKFQAHRVASIDMSIIKSGAHAPVDMILGYNALKQANWFFDFPGKRWAVLKNS